MATKFTSSIAAIFREAKGEAVPFVREKVDPEWLPWVRKQAGSQIDMNGGMWAIDHERDAAFFFEGGDPHEPTQPKNYCLKVGTDVFPVEIINRGGAMQVWIAPCYGAVTSSSEARQLVIEAYQCLRSLPARL
jgi:hypothetical protein